MAGVGSTVELLAQQSKVDERFKLQSERTVVLGDHVAGVTRAVTSLKSSVEDGLQKMSVQLAALNQRVEQLGRIPVRIPLFC